MSDAVEPTPARPSDAPGPPAPPIPPVHPRGTECVDCGYDLGGAQHGVCPECGRSMGEAEENVLADRRWVVRQQWPGRMLLVALVTVTLTGALVGQMGWRRVAERTAIAMGVCIAFGCLGALGVSAFYRPHHRAVVRSVACRRVTKAYILWIVLLMVAAAAMFACGLLDRWLWRDRVFLGVCLVGCGAAALAAGIGVLVALSGLRSELWGLCIHASRPAHALCVVWGFVAGIAAALMMFICARFVWEQVDKLVLPGVP